MSTAGYSGTPLVKKLWIKEGMRVCFVNPPRGYFKTLGKLPSRVVKVKELQPDLDFIQLFTKSESELAVLFPELQSSIHERGMVWISWPKKSSGVASEVSDSVARRLGLATGLVDTKVCAVDDIWSGLKFMVRVKDRKKQRK